MLLWALAEDIRILIRLTAALKQGQSVQSVRNSLQGFDVRQVRGLLQETGGHLDAGAELLGLFSRACVEPERLDRQVQRLGRQVEHRAGGEIA